MSNMDLLGRAERAWHEREARRVKENAVKDRQLIESVWVAIKGVLGEGPDSMIVVEEGRRARAVLDGIVIYGTWPDAVAPGVVPRIRLTYEWKCRRCGGTEEVRVTELADLWEGVQGRAGNVCHICAAVVHPKEEEHV
jgi:hypothetical protein